MPRATLQPTARRDIKRHFVYLAEHAGLPVAERFLTALDLTFADLARMPEIGEACHLTHPRLHDLRRWQVTGFANWLVLYFPRRHGVSVARVVHGSQSLAAIFGLP